jgi:outer membrane receptor protein involved in Fe transport
MGVDLYLWHPSMGCLDIKSELHFLGGKTCRILWQISHLTLCSAYLFSITAIMATAESSPSSAAVSAAPSSPVVVSSDRLVSDTIQQGFQDILIQSVGGFLLGGMAGVVLARGGGKSSARKILAGFGGGVGGGVAWTRTSMKLEDMLRDINTTPTPPSN